MLTAVSAMRCGGTKSDIGEDADTDSDEHTCTVSPHHACLGQAGSLKSFTDAYICVPERTSTYDTLEDV